MDYAFVLCLFAVLSTGFCDDRQTNKSRHEEIQVRKNRETSFRELMVCGLTRDVSCFLDKADAIVEEKTNDILAQADREVLKTTGRADEENSPSQLSKAINKIISEITEMFKDSLSGFFKSAREGEEEDEVDEDEEESEDSSTKDERNSVGEARKKKKKKKLIGLIKLIIIGIVLKAKLTLLLKALSAALQLKFFLVALAGLILNAARFYFDLKKGHQPQKVIYYEHAQHQHHYDGEEDWSSGPGGSDWGRSYDDEQKAAAQDLAYSKQKPYQNYQKVDNNKSSFSWFG